MHCLGVLLLGSYMDCYFQKLLSGEELAARVSTYGPRTYLVKICECWGDYLEQHHIQHCCYTSAYFLCVGRGCESKTLSNFFLRKYILLFNLNSDFRDHVFVQPAARLLQNWWLIVGWLGGGKYAVSLDVQYGLIRIDVEQFCQHGIFRQEAKPQAHFKDLQLRRKQIGQWLIVL